MATLAGPTPTTAVRTGGSAWSVLVAYGLVAAATQMLWLTYAPITDQSAAGYGVSTSTVGWLSEIFPLLYVVLAIPAGIILDRWFRPALAAGGLLVAAGGLIRLGGETFGWALAGQTLVALAQPIVLSAVGKLAGEYLRPEDRATGISVGSAGSFVGMLAALLLGPILGDHGHLERLLVAEGVLAVLPTVALAVKLRGPGRFEGQPSAIARGTARQLWRAPRMRTLCGLVFLGFGIFVALATWLQTLLHPSHVSDTTAGVLLVGTIIAGVVGCAVLPALVDRRHAERRFMLGVVAASIVGSVALAAMPSVGGRAVALVAMGFFLLPALPVVLSGAEQLAGAAAAGTAGAVVWMAGNLGGLVVAVIVQILVHHPVAAFLSLAVVAALGVPLALRLPAAPRPAQPVGSA